MASVSNVASNVASTCVVATSIGLMVVSCVLTACKPSKELEGSRAAGREKMVAEAKVERLEEAERDATARLTAVPLPPLMLRPVDVNTASEAELAAVVSMSSDVAAKIVAEREKRRFNDWADLVNRVVGISQAQTAFYA